MGLTASGAPAGGKVDEPTPHHNPALYGLALAALGIVYGDIGTSPLYTLKTVFDPANGLPLEPLNVIGIAVADLLGADDRRVAQVRRRSSCARTITAKAESWRCLRSQRRRW